jgi:hypothetical protein
MLAVALAPSPLSRILLDDRDREAAPLPETIALHTARRRRPRRGAAVSARELGPTGPWTWFNDVHSGGGAALPWEVIYVEGDEETAMRRFVAILGHDPQHVSCECCGSDYGWSEAPTLEEASSYNRGVRDVGSWPGYEPYSLEEHLAFASVLTLPAGVTALDEVQRQRLALPREAWQPDFEVGFGRRVAPLAEAPEATG